MTNDLDLHGVKHQDVDLLVENFIFEHQNKLPFSIICGNSQKMIELVISVLDRIGSNYDMPRFGLITVFKI